MFAASKKTYISRSKKKDLEERRSKPPAAAAVLKEDKLDEIKEDERDLHETL